MAALEATIATRQVLASPAHQAADPVIDSMDNVLTSVALPSASSLRLPRRGPKAAPRLAPRPRSAPSREQIRQIVAGSGDPIKHCYERELISSTAAKEGRIVFRWIIDSAGKATKITVVKNSIGLPTLQRCIQRQIRSWVFPPCPRGCVVVYPFEFFTRV